MPNAAWKDLSTSDHSDEVVLAVDFDATGRPEARFADLVANLKVDLTVRESVPPEGASEAARDTAGYLAHWAGPLAEQRPRVRAVLGFCAGSVYAAALAERIGRWQETPPQLVLFDPELITPVSVLWQFQKVVGFLPPLISDTELAEARAEGQRLHDEIQDVAQLKTEFLRLTRAICTPAFTRFGLDEKRREEVFDLFRSFLGYLAAAAGIDPADQWRTAVAYSSATPLSGLRGMRSSGRDVVVGREIEVAVEHAAMLADEGLAAEVSDLLNGPWH